MPHRVVTSPDRSVRLTAQVFQLLPRPGLVQLVRDRDFFLGEELLVHVDPAGDLVRSAPTSARRSTCPPGGGLVRRLRRTLGGRKVGQVLHQGALAFREAAVLMSIQKTSGAPPPAAAVVIFVKIPLVGGRLVDDLHVRARLHVVAHELVEGDLDLRGAARPDAQLALDVGGVRRPRAGRRTRKLRRPRRRPSGTSAGSRPFAEKPIASPHPLASSVGGCRSRRRRRHTVRGRCETSVCEERRPGRWPRQEPSRRGHPIDRRARRARPAAVSSRCCPPAWTAPGPAVRRADQEVAGGVALGLEDGALADQRLLLLPH